MDIEDLNHLLDEAYRESTLPEGYDGREKLNTYLLQPLGGVEVGGHACRRG